MTSTTDTTRHPDVSEISDLTEGLLSPSRTADVQHHVDGCELCAEVHTSLVEIRDLLGALPAPEPMPSDIADRIDAALALEAQSIHTAVPEAATDVSRETEPSAAIASPEVTDRPAGHPRAATGPGRRPARRRRRTAVLGAALGAAVVGVSIFLLQNVQLSQSSDDNTVMDRGSSLSNTGTDTFSQSTLEEQVYDLLGSHTDAASPQDSSGDKEAPSLGTKSSPKSTSTTSASPQSPLRAPSVSVPSCVEQGIGRNTGALALERGTYEGADAFLVVLPHPTDAGRVQAYVIDAACVGAEPPAKGKLLLTHTYARP